MKHRDNEEPDADDRGDRPRFGSAQLLPSVFAAQERDVHPVAVQIKPKNPFANAAAPNAPTMIPTHHSGGRPSTAATVSSTIAICSRLVPTANRWCCSKRSLAS